MPKGNQAKGGNEGKLIGDVMEILKNISSLKFYTILWTSSYLIHTHNTCT